MRQTQIHWLLLLVLNGVMLFVIALFNLNVIVAARDNRFDFYPRWAGGQAFWRGEMPYSPAVTAEIQRGMFGGELPPELDQQNFAYPAYTALLLAPLLALPAPVAIAVWMALQFLAIPWTVVIWLVILGWRPVPWLLALLLIGFLLVFRYSMNLFVLAQFTGTMLLLISAGALLLLRGRDVWAGVALALATVPPTIAAPLAVGMLGVYLLRGRWRGLAAFCVTIGGLVLVSALRVGWWLPDFLGVIGQYADYARPLWAASVIDSTVGRVIFVALVAGFALWIAARFWQKADETRQIDLIITGMLAALLLIPQTGNYYMVLLIPPLVVCIYRAHTVPYRGVIWLACGLTVISPWLYLHFTGEASYAEAFLLPAQTMAIWCAVNYPRWLALSGPAAVAAHDRLGVDA